MCAGLQQPPQSLPTGFEAGYSLGAPQLWWATPWVGLGGEHRPKGVGPDEAGIAEATSVDGRVEVGFKGWWLGSKGLERIYRAKATSVFFTARILAASIAHDP